MGTAFRVSSRSRQSAREQHMAATLDYGIADLRRANTELQHRLDEVIAERDEALRQQAATTEILQIISSSPGNLEPVFDAMLEKSMHLCETDFGILFIGDGETFRGAATRNLPPKLEDFVQIPFKPSPGGFFRRALQGQRFE